MISRIDTKIWIDVGLVDIIWNLDIAEENIKKWRMWERRLQNKVETL